MAIDFEYTPLAKREFRLLRLCWKVRPDRGVGRPSSGDPIECDITTFSMDDCPPYTALSYTWGTDKATELLRVNSLTFRIRPNLASFLRHVQPDSARRTCTRCLQSRQSPRSSNSDLLNRPVSCCEVPFPPRFCAQVGYIWIDAICIDQGNLAERTSQIGQMREIYAKSGRIVIWLGPRSVDSNLAIDAWIELAHNYRKNKTPLDDLRLSREQRRALRALYRREWWDRVWVWQEATTPDVPREFWCGPKRAAFEDAEDTNEYIVLCAGHMDQHRLRYAMLANFSLANMGAVHNARLGQTSMTLLSILELSVGLEATDERDKIFAFIPIYQDLAPYAPPPLRPDMYADMSTLMERITVYILETSRDLEVLLHCSVGRSKSQKSWVPLTLRDHALKRWSSQYRADGETPSPFGSGVPFLDASKDLLSLPGVLIDRVCDVHGQLFTDDISNMPSREELSILKERWRTWMVGLAISFSQEYRNHVYHGATGISHALNQVLTCDVTSYRGIRRGYQKSWQFDDIEALKTSLDNNAEVMQMVARIRNHTIFRTTQGYLGQSMDPREGDVVVVFYGLSVPLLLRPKGELWSIVGCCFVAGMMDGEALELNIEPRVFQIC